MALQLLGTATLLYTTDPPFATVRGGLPDTLNIVDFGPGTDVRQAFDKQKAANKDGQSPPMCSEFYTGWLTHWGEPMANTCGLRLTRPLSRCCCACCNAYSCGYGQKGRYNCRSADAVVTSLAQVLAYGGNRGSVSLYMAHGGTNFGFWAGATGGLFIMTSYDYNCPISESGCTGQPGVGGKNKFDVRSSISLYLQRISVSALPVTHGGERSTHASSCSLRSGLVCLPVQQLQAVQAAIVQATGTEPPEVPKCPAVSAYGDVHWQDAFPLLDHLSQLHYSTEPTLSKEALSMEELGMSFGMLHYRCGTNSAWRGLSCWLSPLYPVQYFQPSRVKVGMQDSC